MSSISGNMKDNESLVLSEDTEVHLSTSFSRVRNKSRNKEKIKRSYHLIVKGLLISSIMVGAILGTATSAFASEKPSGIEIPDSYSQTYVKPTFDQEQQSSAYVLNLRMANKLLEAAIKKGELSSSILDSLNTKMNNLMERLDTIDTVREAAILEVDVTDDLLEIGHYQDASDSVLSKREESIKILEQLQNKLGIPTSEHALAAPTKSPEVKILAASPSIQQYRTANVTIDGVTQKFDQSAVVVEGSTLVPMRGVFESLGATIKWDQATQTVTGTKGSTTIKLTIGNKYAHVNGTKVTLAKEALILNGSTMVPLRFVAEALGSKVDWDAPTYTAIITSVKDADSGVTNPGTGSGTVVTNPTNPSNGGNGTGTTNPTGSYVVNGIDATQTQGRLYGTKSQKEYDAVVKIAKDALAKMDSVQIPKEMNDYLNGKRSDGSFNSYNMRLDGYHVQLSPLLDAGISKDAIIKDYKVTKALGQYFGVSSETLVNNPGVESAYDSLVLNRVDCDSSAQAQSLFYDLAGFNTAIVASPGHAYFIVKLDNQWTKLGKPVGTDANAHLKTVTGGFWLVSPN